MKKVISLILALALVMGLGISVCAGEVEGNTSVDVDADYEGLTESNTGKIYSVKITWDSQPGLTYSEGSKTYRWNPETLKYEEVTASRVDAEWKGGTFQVTVTNRSNARVKVTATYSDTASDGVTTEMEWTKQTVTLDSAAPTSYSGTGSAKTDTLSGKVKVTAGTISSATNGVGRITITIDKNVN